MKSSILLSDFYPEKFGKRIFVVLQEGYVELTSKTIIYDLYGYKKLLFKNEICYLLLSKNSNYCTFYDENNKNYYGVIVQNLQDFINWF